MNKDKVINLALVATAAVVMMTAVNAHAISASHRAALEWSGCNMETESTWCDIHKPRSYNEKHRPASEDPAFLKSTIEAERRDIAALVEDKVLAQPRHDAFAALQEFGFMRENDGDFFKISGGKAWHVLMTFNAADEVATATIK
ncbi:hypothetical protein [Erwinia sp. S59]|uniref:hypothetical protein n=1 Tax=Erwinia sp. S59 TaxID=2769340 RepID=UPI00190B89C9|nr:hypothetical protein [Erwinia sp. S59]MBK0092819.1 hypothetical protein [Erwinia sp. S59]